MNNNCIRVIGVFFLLFSTPVARAHCFGKHGMSYIDSNVILKTVDSLIKNKKSDREKIRAIYQWVRININYDDQRWKTYHTKDFQNRTIDVTFNLRRGICMDIAQLICFMLSAANIKSEVIYGVGRNNESDFIKSPDQLRHAWNAVFIEDKWLFMDATWAGSNINDPWADDYFLISPEAFIFTHFPDDSKWLLLDKTLTLGMFEQLPIVRSHFYEFIKSSPPKKGVYTVHNDFIVINDLPVNNKTAEDLNVRISKINDDNFLDADVILIKQEQQSFFKINIPEQGMFYVSITGKLKEEDGFTTEVDLITFLVKRK